MYLPAQANASLVNRRAYATHHPFVVANTGLVVCGKSESHTRAIIRTTRID